MIIDACKEGLETVPAHVAILQRDARLRVTHPLGHRQNVAAHLRQGDVGEGVAQPMDVDSDGRI